MLQKENGNDFLFFLVVNRLCHLLYALKENENAFIYSLVLHRLYPLGKLFYIKCENSSIFLILVSRLSQLRKFFHLVSSLTIKNIIIILEVN